MAGRYYGTKIKLDANHREIVNDIKKIGGDVVEILFPVDIYAQLGYGSGAFLEIKIEGSKACYTFDQLQWIASSGKVNVAIVKSSDEAIETLKTLKTLSLDQKNKLAMFLYQNKKARYQPSEIEKVLYA